MYKEIDRCRICGNTQLHSVIHLGEQALTGVFPARADEKITTGPVELVKCVEDDKGQYCGLLQMRQSYDGNELYGNNYGYRSGLNQSMVRHLQENVLRILQKVTLERGDIVLDIGSNDGTLLKSYGDRDVGLIGMDPLGSKFKDFYPQGVQLITDFFSAKNYKRSAGSRPAKVITSFAMFYDIEDPLDFMRQVRSILHQEGVWAFEQSYMPAMVKKNSYDTICHEHLEYYRLKQIDWMVERADLKIIDAGFNEANGGSFFVMVARKGSKYKSADAQVQAILKEEEARGFNGLDVYRDFVKTVMEHKVLLKATIGRLKAQGCKVFGYGASTKGNVILQWCGLNVHDIPMIADVNPDKFGCFTPGTSIPIVPEEVARNEKPDYFLVLPWHFRENLIHRERKFLSNGGKMLFPLPVIEVVGA